jgi:predicted AAA+ superfamily ATPase
MSGNELKIGRGGVNAIRSAIRAQTEELVDQLQHLVEIGKSQVDQLATIEQRFMEGH